TAAVCVGSTPIAFTLRAARRTIRTDRADAGESLAVELSASPSADVARIVAARAAAFVGATDDVVTFYARAEGDRAMAPLVRQLHGLHHVRFLTLGEIAVYSVLMQRAPISIAASLKRRFFAAFGRPVDVALGEHVHTLHALPELADLRALTADEIAAAIKHRGKAERIVDVVRGVADLGEDFLRDAPYAEARDALLAIRGVGPFSAAAILLRGLGRMDELPWLPQFAGAAHELYGKPVSQDALVARYGTSIGYWSFYVKTGLPRRAAAAASAA
ncbi:MAG: hypothetical protein HOV81_02130, partial [Kofleriaceae bacterium]|nr:hypothetical protein [Kofleriaceae bacterium]